MADTPSKSIFSRLDTSLMRSTKPEETSKEKIKEAPRERTNVRINEPTNQRTIKRHSFDVFTDQLISLDNLQNTVFQATGKKPKIGSLVREALEDLFEKYKKRTNQRLD